MADESSKNRSNDSSAERPLTKQTQIEKAARQNQSTKKPTSSLHWDE